MRPTGAGRPVGTALGLALLLGLGTAGCSEDPYERYCAEVEAQQEPLSEAVGTGSPTALISALPSLTALEAEAPPDLRDEWGLVVGRVEELLDALEAADVDPATYDREDPPGGLARQDRTRIDAAAAELTSPATVAAFAGVQQQARDVCKTPLSL